MFVFWVPYIVQVTCFMFSLVYSAVMPNIPSAACGDTVATIDPVLSDNSMLNLRLWNISKEIAQLAFASYNIVCS